MSDVIQSIRAVCERNRRDYEELAKMTGQTVTQIEADTTAPDPRCICPDCAGTGTQVVSTGIMPEHGNLEQESCDRCGGAGTIAQGKNGVTDEDARALVKDLRAVAERNKTERNVKKGEYWQGQCDGRTGAYKLAAGWLEQIIHGEADGE